MEKVIKVKEVNIKFNHLLEEAMGILTILARDEFEVDETETHDKDYFFSSKIDEGVYFLFNGLTMLGGNVPLVRGIEWCGINMHIEKVIPITLLPTSDIFTILSYIEDIYKTRGFIRNAITCSTDKFCEIFIKI